MKKFLALLLTIGMMLTNSSAFAISYPDVDSSASYANAVDVLTALNIVDGDDKGLFNPDNTITRAEFTKMVVAALAETTSAESLTATQFIADSTKHWARGYIQQGVADKFIEGYDDTHFGPDDTITFAQACKMLVNAINYTVYAENQGGWPAGYVAQASSLGISKGVSASNDTNLTRAQVAIMIYNTLDVPLNVIDSWETQSTFNGIVQVPVTKKKNGRDKDYETLLTEKHNAYKVKGRVVATTQSDNLNKDEIRYSVEKSDRYIDLTYPTTNGSIAENEIMLVGETAAANMLFAYSEAIVQKDLDTDDITILSIVNYGNSQFVTFDAADVSNEGDDANYVKNEQLRVYKDVSSLSTYKYNLSKEAKLYVNGKSLGTYNNQNIDKYIINNPTGKVTLVDATNVGSTTTDGEYDYIMVDYYIDAIVDSVQTTSSLARIYFKDSTVYGLNYIKWDPEDKDLDIKFTSNGKSVDYTALKEYDVLSIKYDVTEGFINPSYYDIAVSNSTVTGVISSRDVSMKPATVTMNNNEYSVTDSVIVNGLDLGTEYTCYLDTFGYIAYIEEGISEKNYGVIVAMYTSAGNDYPTVRMISADGAIVSYEVKDENEAKMFYNYAVNGDKDKDEEYKSFTKSDIKNNIKAGNTVVTYKLSGNKIKFDKAINPVGEANMEYKKSNSRLGGYTIDEKTTRLIDIDSYINGSDNTVNSFAISDLENESEYTAYLYDRNNAGVYRFGIILDGTTSIRPTSSIAVVAKVGGVKDNDGTQCTIVTLEKDNQEIQVDFEGNTVDITEGDIIAYTVSAEGYVETNNVYILMDADDNYNSLRNTIFDNEDNYTKAYINNKYIVADGDNYSIVYNGNKSNSKNVYIYAGPVYKKVNNSLDLFIGKTDNKSSIIKTTEIKNFATNGANQYVVNYTERRNSRVSISSWNITDSIFSQAYTDTDKNTVDWNRIDDDINPVIAVVKEVDKVVTDVIYYVGE